MGAFAQDVRPRRRGRLRACNHYRSLIASAGGDGVDLVAVGAQDAADFRGARPLGRAARSCPRARATACPSLTSARRRRSPRARSGVTVDGAFFGLTSGGCVRRGCALRWLPAASRRRASSVAPAAARQRRHLARGFGGRRCSPCARRRGVRANGWCRAGGASGGCGPRRFAAASGFAAQHVAAFGFMRGERNESLHRGEPDHAWRENP